MDETVSVVELWIMSCLCSTLQEVAGFAYFMMGALAKMVSTFVTYPLQVIQSRLRVGGPLPHGALYIGGHIDLIVVCVCGRV